MSLNESLASFQSRLLLSIHGIPERELRGAIFDVIAKLADQELDLSAQLPRDHSAQPLAELLENLWHSRRRNLSLADRLGDESLLASAVDQQERALAEIERIKRERRLSPSHHPDVSGVVAGSASGAEPRSPGPGIRIHTLWQRGVSRALQVELDPGAKWPGIDYHVPGPEEVFIVSGDLDDGANHYQAGTFLHHPAGSSHSPRSENGCVLFVFYPEG